MIKAKIIEDSISKQGHRITSIQLEYPRFILPELNTHRVFSRSSSSSRAIPIKKFLERIDKDPVYPIHWGKNQKGMQAYSELSTADKERAKDLWRLSVDSQLEIVKQLDELNLHKQVANRLLEPFMWQKTIVTSTEWNNFFALRYHHSAQPEIKELSKKMYEAYTCSTPKLLHKDQWHLPYIQDWEKASLLSESKLLRMSSARCARVSFDNHDGTSCDISTDLNLYGRLMEDMPKHASPTEHQAKPCGRFFKQKSKWGNFQGWIQHRKLIKDENLTKFEVGMYG